MAWVYVDRTDDGRISVCVATSVREAKTRLFADRSSGIRPGPSATAAQAD